MRLAGLSQKAYSALPAERREFWCNEARKAAAIAGDEEEGGWDARW